MNINVKSIEERFLWRNFPFANNFRNELTLFCMSIIQAVDRRDFQESNNFFLSWSDGNIFEKSDGFRCLQKNGYKE